ncbi:hypothetical protein [Streptococcus catagoni]|uniref:hypothetical protein n=1 Tax=Streptococcus catagoni TaxID=2654874 RepID=UPI00140D8466|nr:hypothetical protein [Streptococcus catagoni]
MKEKELIYERSTDYDKRVKSLYPSQASLDLIKILNKAQEELIQSIVAEKGENWYPIMESLAQKRQGFNIITQDWKDQ